MSSCRINTNLTSGSQYVKSDNSEQAKEINDKFAALMAKRLEQDKAMACETLSEKDYEAKYGKQPNSTDAKKQ
jgi:hypothetical protein